MDPYLGQDYHFPGTILKVIESKKPTVPPVNKANM